MKFLDSILETSSNCTRFMEGHAPEILTYSGIVLGIVATSLACKASHKAKRHVEEHNEEKKALLCDNTNEDEVSKDIVKENVAMAVDVVKEYIPAAVVGGVAIACIIKGNQISKKRIAELSAAYSTLDSIFKRYRKNVVEELGEEADRRFRYGIKKKKITEEYVDPETGKKKKKTSEVDVIEDDGLSEYSDYARFFDSSSKEWDKDPEYNLTFLKGKQSMMNNILKARGYLFLNDVYEALGLPPSKAGQCVGWVYDKDGGYDNRVDFGIYNVKRAANRDFVNGYESVILLDFNVDGNILDRFTEWKI